MRTQISIKRPRPNSLSELSEESFDDSHSEMFSKTIRRHLPSLLKD